MIPIFTGQQAKDHLATLLSNSEQENDTLSQAVKSTLQMVKVQGDSALLELAKRFGDTIPTTLRLEDKAVQNAIARVPASTREVLERSAENIRAFGQAVMDSLQPVHLVRNGFQVGMDLKPVTRVGCYVPGGRYPLPSTALMTAITAQVAGVSEIVIASPALPDEVIYAGSLAGVRDFYQTGGAQAIAALAFGTQTIAPVDMIVGPGNAYVTEAKRQVQGLVGIDMLAGPSEVAIIADAQANPDWIALDMLAQSEHDPDARAYLFTDSPELAQAVFQAIAQKITELALPDFINQSINAGAILVFSTLDACVSASNQIAPEHLEVHTADPYTLKSRLSNYGALFIGYTASVPFGDYMAGPNHTLPTGRTARFAGGLSPLTFLRPQSWVEVGDGLSDLARDTHAFATLEGLTAHGAAASARIR